jgi:hypothetical protein
MTQVIYKQILGINVISLTGGTHYEMGAAYGSTLNTLLQSTRDTLVTNFNSYNITYEQMAIRAEGFYNRYSYTYKLFLNGVANGSGLSQDDVNILNGMETLNSLIPDLTGLDTYNTEKESLVNCAFIFLPPEKTVSGFSIIGRNYDFPPTIYGEIAANLTITVINDLNSIPTAIIGMPGQIYCPSCTNQQGLFMELNNGMPSGGYNTDHSRESMLINMLEVMQDSSSLDEMHTQMLALQSDYSLIISTANSTTAGSFEYSCNSSLGMKPYFPPNGEVLVYTNFYLNSSWGNEIPVPTDPTTWEGISRRDNLLKLASADNKFDLDEMKELMEVPLDNGGAFWEMTIYQVVFEPSENLISLRRSYADNQSWVDIDLDDFYA